MARQDRAHRHLEVSRSTARPRSAGSTSTATARATSAATAANNAPCSSTRSSPTLLAVRARSRRLSSSDSSARTSPSRASATTTSASATATGSATPSSRSPSRASPASGVGMRLGVPDDALAAGRPAPARLLLPRHHRGRRCAAGDEIVRTRRGPHEMSVADIDALLYLPDRDSERAAGPPSTSRRSAPAGSSPSATCWPATTTPRRRPASNPAGPGSGRCGSATSSGRARPSRRSASSPDDGSALPRPRPGQYLTLRVASAADPAPVRSYSLSSAPTGDGYRISVKRDGVASTWLHEQLPVGATRRHRGAARRFRAAPTAPNRCC